MEKGKGEDEGACHGARLIQNSVDDTYQDVHDGCALDDDGDSCGGAIQQM
jgi:hypothetical protein